jgi:hypothetical protein
MAVAMLFEMPGTTQAQYDAVIKDLDLHGKPLPNGLFHVAGPMEGGWIFLDLWETEEAANKAFQERIGPAMQRAGVTPLPPKTVFPVHNMLQL